MLQVREVVVVVITRQAAALVEGLLTVVLHLQVVLKVVLVVEEIVLTLELRVRTMIAQDATLAL
jgi:hypothetical protein